MKITYNSPVILTFTFASLLVMLISIFIKDMTFILGLRNGFSFANPLDYVRLFSYTLVHQVYVDGDQLNIRHFVGNFTIILLIGPYLEEKYGGKKLLQMMIITALITALIHLLTSEFGLIGASGIAFMFICLGSITNHRRGELPLTFIIVSIFFLGSEILGSLKADGISQMAHIVGGISGAVYGFFYKR